MIKIERGGMNHKIENKKRWVTPQRTLVFVMFFTGMIACNASSVTVTKDPGFKSSIVIEDFSDPVTTYSDLNQAVVVESRLPAYVNMDSAIMVFDRSDPAGILSVGMSFVEQNSGIIPASPMSIVLSGPSLRCEQQIDISSWPDGEYKVFISAQGCTNAPLVRGIRKQTIAPPLSPDEPVAIDGSKMFFVDDWYFEKTTGLDRKLNQAELIPIEPWKTNPEYKFPVNYIKDFWFDQSGNLNVHILAFTSSRQLSRDYWVRSNDLETWEIVSEVSPKSEDCSIVNLGNPSVPLPDDTVYRQYDPVVDGEVDLSQVRIRYSYVSTTWGDIPIPARSRLAVWERPGEDVLVLGDPITVGKSVFAEDEIGTWADANDNFGDLRFSPDGQTLSFQQTCLIPRHDPFVVHYDNNHSERILVTWSTTNGLDWIPSFFDAPTLEDPWSLQHYGVDIWDEEDNSLQFSYLRMYDCQLQKLYTDLVYSRDGVDWNRIENNKPFLETGARGTFNYGVNIPEGGSTSAGWERMTWDGYYYEPIRWSMNALHFMFLIADREDDRSFITPEFYSQHLGGRMVGEYGVENSPIMDDYEDWDDICEQTKEWMITPVFMRYRMDGWISALPQEQELHAEIITKILQADGPLGINAKAEPDGFVLVEVLDPYGNELEAYSESNAAFFRGDKVDGALAWSDGLVTELPSGAFKLRITLEKAEIFTLEF